MFLIVGFQFMKILKFKPYQHKERRGRSKKSKFNLLQGRKNLCGVKREEASQAGRDKIVISTRHSIFPMNQLDDKSSFLFQHNGKILIDFLSQIWAHVFISKNYMVSRLPNHPNCKKKHKFPRGIVGKITLIGLNYLPTSHESYQWRRNHLYALC